MTSNLKLIMAYFAKLEAENYHGTVEVTLQGGRLKFTREMKSRQDFEIAVESWDVLPPEAQADLRDRFGDNAKFQALVKGTRK